MEQRIRKMYRQDVRISLGFTIFLWLVLFYVMYSLNVVVPEMREKAVIIACGVLVACYATVTIFAVINHLTRNRDELYSEEINCELKADH